MSQTKKKEYIQVPVKYLCEMYRDKVRCAAVFMNEGVFINYTTVSTKEKKEACSCQKCYKDLYKKNKKITFPDINEPSGRDYQESIYLKALQEVDPKANLYFKDDEDGE